MRFEMLDAGYCRHPQHIVLRNRSLKLMDFPAMFGLIEHPQHGVILYDTGYAEHFFAATRPFPERLYAWVTPTTLPPGCSARERLAARGIAAEDVGVVIIGHFHGDHAAGLLDFPRARFVFRPEAWRHLQALGRVRAIAQGYLKALIPPDLEARAWALEDRDSRPLPPECAPFTRGWDLFGDASVVLTDLAGHAVGHLGLFVAGDPPAFLVGDAAWHSRSYREHILPHPMAQGIFADTAAYAETLRNIAAFARARPDALIIPSHCEEMHAALVAEPSRPRA